MNNKYEFFIAGRARNKENIFKICNLFGGFRVSSAKFQDQLSKCDSWS